MLAAVVALALTVASVIGAYAHAAGHQPAHEGHPAATSVAVMADHCGKDGPAAAELEADRGHARALGACGHNEDRPGHSLDCCDTICNGGQAILAAVLVVPSSLPSGPAVDPAAVLHGADPGGLDRPPKPFRSA